MDQDQRGQNQAVHLQHARLAEFCRFIPPCPPVLLICGEKVHASSGRRGTRAPHTFRNQEENLGVTLLEPRSFSSSVNIGSLVVSRVVLGSAIRGRWGDGS